ncbi:MAG: MBL fold metallo-hydrolase [Planctomycetota bacterium]
MRFADWTVTEIDSGHVFLDGGAMFGNVPKVLWEREHPADDKNRIDLAMRCLVLERGERRFLVDTGAGDKWDDKLRGIYGLGPSRLEASLRAAGIEPESITDVVLTHLHFDHAGGVSSMRDGEARLVFPQAVHWVQRRNLDNARRPGIRERASYLPENVEPVAAGRVELLDGDVEIAPGLSVRAYDGHTVGLQVVRLATPEGGLVYAADMIPTSSHLRGPYTMGYDICAGRLVEEKATLLEDCLDHGLLVCFEHDPRHAAAALERAEGKIRAAAFRDL